MHDYTVSPIAIQGNSLYQVTTPWATLLFSQKGGQLLQYTLVDGTDMFWSPLDHAHREIFCSDTVRLHSGCPLSSPWFGQLAANPQSIQKLYQSADRHPSHGYVRSALWSQPSIRSTVTANSSMGIEIAFQLEGVSIPAYPAEGLCWTTITTVTAEGLQLEVVLDNQGDREITVSQGLHNYFAISDLNTLVVHGLDGTYQWDAADNWKSLGMAPPAFLGEPCDRVFTNVASPITWMARNALQCKLTLINCSDLVIWNPGTSHPLSQSLWNSNQWRSFICIEPATLLDNAVTIAKGQQARFGYILNIVSRKD